jgi:hypothetical protein
MTSAQRPSGAIAATNPGVQSAARLLHHRWGWIWTMVASLAGFVVAAASAGTGRTASFLLDLIGLVMVVVFFVVALAMVVVDTARLRQHAPAVRGPALATHRTDGARAGVAVGSGVGADQRHGHRGRQPLRRPGLRWRGVLAVFIIFRPRLERLRSRGRGR